MKLLPILALVATAAVSAPVVAQDAAPAVQTAEAGAFAVRRGQLVFSSEGRRVGRVEVLVGDAGAPSAVKVIKDSKLVSIPVSTLSAGDRDTRVNTTLAYKDIK